MSENSVSLNPMVLLIIIPIKWLFHWEYTLFSDKPIWQLLVWQTKAEKRGDHYSLEQTSPESLPALSIEGNAKKCCRSAQQKPLCPLLWPLGLLGRPMNARPCTRHSFADRSRCSDELLWYVHYLLVNHFHSISVVG